MPTLPVQTRPVTVQLIDSDGACWEAVYGSTQKNVAEQFKAKADP